MFGTTKIRSTPQSSTRTRMISKTTAYTQARAVDEALNGFLRRNSAPAMNGQTYPLLFFVMAERAWRMKNLSFEDGKKGEFTVSSREFRAKIGDEELKARESGKPEVKRRPPENFHDLIRREWKKLREFADGGDAPAEWFFKLRFWNEQSGTGYVEECPNPDRADELGLSPMNIMDKKRDTVAMIEYVEPDEAEVEDMRTLIAENLLSEKQLEEWEYRTPTKLLNDQFVEAEVE